MNLTPNFKLAEFACKDGTLVPASLMPNIIRLAVELQKLRDTIGKPIHINSAYRTPTYNRKIGGAKNSMHVQGKAADITVKGMTSTELYDTIEKLIAEKVVDFKGVGVYDTFVHVDIRGYKARWDMRRKG